MRELDSKVGSGLQVLKLYLHENEMKHFQNELEINMKIPADHPYIIRANLIRGINEPFVYQNYSFKEYAYITMDYCPNGDLFNYVKID